MRIRNFILIVVLLLVTLGFGSNLPYGFPDTERVKTKINADWKFYLGNPDADFYEKNTDDSGWETVCVPHTLKLTSIALDGCKDDKAQLTFHRDVGWYRKNVSVSENPGKKVFLEFEGAHQVTDLWVNGKHVGQHTTSGYTPFHFDITNFIEYGADNQVTLLVDNRKHEHCPPDPGIFDFVKFSGLYRDVYLVETDPMHITFNWDALKAGVTITTPSVDPVNMNATINIKTVVRNESDNERSCTVLNRIIDKDGFVVLRLTDTKNIPSHQSYEFNQVGGIEFGAHMWSIENPYLYRVNTLILEDGKEIDFVENKMGLRKFEHDEKTGFKLNGKEIELIGFNRHQALGYVGDAVPNYIHYKDMVQFKEMGFNIVRTSHYPQDDALIEACDELGILVYEEGPTWINTNHSEKWYDNLEQASRVMVRNHRNHPSVVIWGAGINHRGYVPRIQYAIKQEDPTRLTASQSSRWTGWQTSGVTDIFGNMNYGPVEWNREEPLLAMEGGSGPETIAKYKRDPMLTGMISWVAHAYYTFHPSKDSTDRTRSGEWTIFRHPKTRIHWYPTELKSTPMVYVASEWQKGIRELLVYSNCDKVQLLINDKNCGEFFPSNEQRYIGLEHPPFHIPIENYNDGKVIVNGIADGKIVASQTVFTPSKPVAIQFDFDNENRPFIADGSDIMIGHAKVVDKNGMVIKNADFDIKFSIKGNASIVGDGKGIGANPVKVRNGIAPVLVRSSQKPGNITVTASAKGLKSASSSTETTPAENNMILANAKPVFDMERIRVDIGEHGQLIQFDWIPWNGVDNETSTMKFDAFNGLEASIKPASDTGVIRWLGEMNVIGLYGYVYGEGVLGIDDGGLVLELNNLPKGKYKIKTYHHFVPVSKTDSMDPNRDKLKAIKIHKLPCAQTIAIQAHDKNGKSEPENVRLTRGNNMQNKQPATFTQTIESDGENSIKIVFKDADGNKGVWLNGFELTECPPKN